MVGTVENAADAALDRALGHEEVVPLAAGLALERRPVAAVRVAEGRAIEGLQPHRVIASRSKVSAVMPSSDSLTFWTRSVAVLRRLSTKRM